MPETVCSISRNAAEDPCGLYHSITPEPIGNSLTGSRTAGTDTDRAGICWKRSEQPRTISAGTDTALSYRPCRNNSALCNPAPTDTDRNRNRPTNRADRISPNRSRQTGAVCHGQPAPDFSQLSGQGIVQPVHCSPIAMQGSAFCGFLR